MTRILAPFVWRGAVLWALLRLALYAVTPGKDPLTNEILSRTDRLTLAPPAILAVAAITVALVFIDMAALRERVFLANLGVDRESIAALVFVTVLALEILASLFVPALP